MIDSATKILVFQALGEGAAFAFSIPIPGPVIGMLLLFLYLLAREHEAERLAVFSTKFLRHMALLFIPAAVGIMQHLDRVADEWLPILAALTISTWVSIAATAVVTRRIDHG
ncbi:CidA/LrgA family protein [Noviherbaspirillum sp.]|uniref:CidA/LrgA family protein n=1 Tax=Noviherbaspirillum sp. TaxID=1926288 RepID=UPI002D4A848C|nr:CidA/LrgA family protein [Noviherbaspirillum sp.]HZW20351.1 CidA/LrgA family protein [Noviherbaspirillum sp.]